MIKPLRQRKNKLRVDAWVLCPELHESSVQSHRSPLLPLNDDE